MTTIVAEIGINHHGNLEKALRMCVAAKHNGADIAKFQLYRPGLILGYNSPHFEAAKQAQFSKKEHEQIKKYCDGIGIEYGLSLFHCDHVEWAESIGLRRYKVASRSIKDLNLLAAINQTKKPVIVSTGMATNRDINRALDWLTDCPVTFLYCECEYPTPLNHVSLRKMTALRQFAMPVGLSSHCPNVVPSMAAIALGASVIEHHVCESNEEIGPDITSSITFDQLNELSRHAKTLEAIA